MKPEVVHLDLHYELRRGYLTVIEDIPFKIKRIFFVYGVPTNETRGGHAHKKCHQLLICTSGAILVKTSGNLSFVLDCPDTALYIPPMNFVEMIFITEDAVLMVLASEKYNEDDYVYGEIND